MELECGKYRMDVLVLMGYGEYSAWNDDVTTFMYANAPFSVRGGGLYEGKDGWSGLFVSGSTNGVRVGR